MYKIKLRHARRIDLRTLNPLQDRMRTLYHSSLPLQDRFLTLCHSVPLLEFAGEMGWGRGVIILVVRVVELVDVFGAVGFLAVRYVAADGAVA